MGLPRQPKPLARSYNNEPLSRDQIYDKFNAMALQGRKPVLDHDMLIEAGLYREEAQGEATKLADALRRMHMGSDYGVFVKHVGAGAGWGVYLGPMDN